MTIALGTVDDLSAKLLEVEVRFRRPWILDRQFYLCTITLAMLGTSVFPTEHISNPSQVPIVSDETCENQINPFFPRGMLCAGPFAHQLHKLAMRHLSLSPFLLIHLEPCHHYASIMHK